LLNAKAVEFYFKHIASIKRGNYFEYMGNVGNLPFIKYHSTPTIDLIIQKVDRILGKTKLDQKIKNFPNEYIQEYRSMGEEFDSINISFNSNHKAIEPVIEKDVNGRGYNIVIGKKEKPVFVESEIKADYVVTALKGKNAKKDEKKLILIPKSDAIVEEILKKLENDKAKTESPSVVELEKEINELVYKLYELDEKDVKVIEDFLRRF
jgi:hypothetical protein